jgi:hypothetical protein
MLEYFANQTGSMSFQFDIMPQTSINGFSFGISGSGSAFAFSGISGELVDADGLVVGSYRSNQALGVSGNFLDGKANYSVNGILTRTGMDIPQSGWGAAFFEKSGVGEYFVSFSMRGN